MNNPNNYINENTYFLIINHHLGDIGKIYIGGAILERLKIMGGLDNIEIIGNTGDIMKNGIKIALDISNLYEKNKYLPKYEGP